MAEKKREHLHRKFSLNREIVLKTPFLCQWRSWAAGFSKNEQLSTHIFSVMRRYRTRVSELVSKTVEPTWLMWPWWVKIPTEDFTDEQQFNNSKPHCPALVVHLLHPRHSLCQFTPRGARNKQWYIKTSFSEPGLALEIFPLLSVVLVPRSLPIVLAMI